MRADAAFQDRDDEERTQFPIWKILSDGGYLYSYSSNLYFFHLVLRFTRLVGCKRPTPKGIYLFISQHVYVWKIQVEIYVLQRKQPKQ
jgi:hypothetical protein